mmetsp:Transcript_56718/g.184599  ORF Transcript_56718/g.184599 Transcript_56718/m.184599 type:complete len:256 (-) Transcript_56718:93-860(-)
MVRRGLRRHLAAPAAVLVCVVVASVQCRSRLFDATAFFGALATALPPTQDFEAERRGFREQLAARGIAGAEAEELEEAVRAADGLQGATFQLITNADWICPPAEVNGWVAELVAILNVQRQFRARGRTNADIEGSIPESARQFLKQAIDEAFEGRREKSASIIDLMVKELGVPLDELQFLVTQAALIARMKDRGIWLQGIGLALDDIKLLMKEEVCPLRLAVDRLEGRGLSAEDLVESLRLALEIEDRSRKLRAS